MGRTINLEKIGERSAADFLRDVARTHETLRVMLEDGDVVTLDPCVFVPETNGDAPLTLRPLPKFQGTIPPGWKDAIYDLSESEL